MATQALQLLFRPFFYLKKIMPRSLFGRSLIIIVMPLILMQISLGYVFYDRHTQTIVRNLSMTFAGNIQILAELTEETEDFAHLAEKIQKNMGFLIQLRPQKTAFIESEKKDDWLSIQMADALHKYVQHPFSLKMSEDHIHVDVLLSKGVLSIHFLKKRLFSRTTPIVLIWTLISSILFFIVSSLFMRNQIRPIRYLADAATQFGKGADMGRFKPEGAEEVRKAGIAFNVMRERLRRQLTDRMDMLAGVSHDLRTPLARIRLQLEMMPASEEVQYLKEDVCQMQEMLQGFLDFARGSGEEQPQHVQVNGLIRSICDQLKPKKIKIDVICDDAITWSIKVGVFNRCLTNLLVNSERYGSIVVITVREMVQTLIITIDDNGPGIPLEERENVFKPFFRLDASRNVDVGGVGLGLSIARDGIRSHGGQITLDDTPEKKGLRVTIRLPR